MTVLTGAGVSAESGVPTFRGTGGLWRGRDPMSLATPEAFADDPLGVWEWYDWRRQAIAKAKPNPAHHAIRRIEESSGEFLLVTQNVDGLHATAGSGRIVELHGNLWRLRCTGDGAVRDDRRVPLRPLPPRCDCGALMRPDVVWFGEALPDGAIASAIESVSSCDLLLVVGTSTLVQPAASLPLVALERGVWVVEINPEPTPLSNRANERIAAPAGEALPRLVGRADELRAA